MAANEIFLTIGGDSAYSHPSGFDDRAVIHVEVGGVPWGPDPPPPSWSSKPAAHGLSGPPIDGYQASF